MVLNKIIVTLLFYFKGILSTCNMYGRKNTTKKKLLSVKYTVKELNANMLFQ